MLTILIFSMTTILTFVAVAYIVYLIISYQKTKKTIQNEKLKSSFYNKKLLLFWILWFFIIVLGCFIFITVVFILLEAKTLKANFLGYMYVAIGIVNYFFILLLIVGLNITAFSFFIFVTEDQLILLNIKIKLNKIIGLKLSKGFATLNYINPIDGLDDHKIVFGKKLINFLKKVET